MCLVKCLQALSLDEFDYISSSKWGPLMEPLSWCAKEAIAPEWESVSVLLTDSSKKNITMAPDSAVAPAYANYTGKAVNQARRPNLYALAPLKWPLSINLEGAIDASLSQPSLMN